MPLELNISPLKDAVARLEESYELACDKKAHTSEAMARTLRAGAIQNFENVYGLSLNMLERFLEKTEASPQEVENGTFKGLVRLASARGLLLNDLAAWDEYRKKRNTTSHTYNEQRALEVFEIIPGFIREARYLRDQLQDRIPRI